MGYQQVGDKKNVIYRELAVLFPHQLIMIPRSAAFTELKASSSQRHSVLDRKKPRQQY